MPLLLLLLLSACYQAKLNILASHPYPLPYSTQVNNAQELRIYIEGDGQGGSNSMGYKLFQQDPTCNKIYLGRPCQWQLYNSNLMCKELVIHSRYSNEVIASFQQALDLIKKEQQNKDFTLIGYSGGGAIALLLAAQRQDIKQIITIAGNLNSDLMSELHQVPYLKNSLNPYNVAHKIANIAQLHLVGGKDCVVPWQVAHSYYEKSPSDKVVLKVIPQATHNSGWEEVFNYFP